MRLMVTSTDRIAADTVQIRLADPSGALLPTFQAGAHVELSFGSFTRCYSLTSSPARRSQYEICILRHRPSRGGSAYLHDRLRTGEVMEVSEPRNSFSLRSGVRHSVFIAGGIGITPFLPMLAELDARGASRELHYTARSAAHFIRRTETQRYTTLYASDGGLARLEVASVLERLSTTDELYVCGPQSLILAVRQEAALRSWAAAKVHSESFGAQQRPGDYGFTVRLAQTGMAVAVDPSQTILDCLLDHGVWAPYACRRGECGSCAVAVVAGQPDHRDVCLTDEQRLRSTCICVSRSHTRELVLDL